MKCFSPEQNLNHQKYSTQRDNRLDCRTTEFTKKTGNDGGSSQPTRVSIILVLRSVVALIIRPSSSLIYLRMCGTTPQVGFLSLGFLPKPYLYFFFLSTQNLGRAPLPNFLRFLTSRCSSEQSSYNFLSSPSYYHQGTSTRYHPTTFTHLNPLNGLHRIIPYTVVTTVLGSNYGSTD